MEIGLIANSNDRRYELFAAAARRFSAQLRHLTWPQLLDSPASLALLRGTDVVRIESPGKNGRWVERFASRIARIEGPIDRREIKFLSEVYQGFSSVLRCVGEAGTKMGLSFMNSPLDIASMFDKAESHRRLLEAGVTRPRCFVAPANPEELDRTLSRQDNRRWFLKPLYGSSGSGVCAYRWHETHRQLVAPIEMDRSTGVVRLFNSRRIRSYTNPRDIDELLSVLLPHGVLCEAWLPKATLGGTAFDLRILVIAGEARHVVVRMSRHPMTNLHLGGQREGEDAFTRAFGVPTLETCSHAAVEAAQCFPDSLYCGVDVLVSPNGSPHVLEVNAFGDLLPGILSRGQSTYEAIVDSYIRIA